MSRSFKKNVVIKLKGRAGKKWANILNKKFRRSADKEETVRKNNECYWVCDGRWRIEDPEYMAKARRK